MAYVVTGAGGHLGNRVVQRLIGMGCEVRALVFSRRDREALAGMDCEMRQADVLYTAQTEDAIRPGDTVIHCAGMVSITARDKRVYNVNVLGTKNVIEACRRKCAAKLVYVSSVHAIPEKPKGQVITETAEFAPGLVRGYYAKTKAEATAAVLAAKDVPVTVVHPSGIIGPYDSGRGHITQLITDYINGRLPACVRGGYDFADVRDVAAGVCQAALRGKDRECYILSGAYSTIENLLALLHEMYPDTRKLKCLPVWIAKAAAPFFELTGKIAGRTPLYTSYSLYTLSSNSAFSNAKAVQELGYVTRPLRDTLFDTVEWLKEVGRCRISAPVHGCV